MSRLLLLLVAGVVLSGGAGLIGGVASLAGGLIATASQFIAVLLLRSKMAAPGAEFTGRWIGGMAVRLVGLAVAMLTLPPLQGGVAYIGVLLPLLFSETVFLK
jgi:F0F1-type ATP synthase assembly protein I